MLSFEQKRWSLVVTAKTNRQTFSDRNDGGGDASAFAANAGQLAVTSRPACVRARLGRAD